MQKSRMAKPAGNAAARWKRTYPSPPRSSLFLEQTTRANIRSHADQDQQWCRPPSAPVRKRFYVLSMSFCSLRPSIYGVWWLGHVSSAADHRLCVTTGFYPPSDPAIGSASSPHPAGRSSVDPPRLPPDHRQTKVAVWTRKVRCMPVRAPAYPDTLRQQRAE